MHDVGGGGGPVSDSMRTPQSTLRESQVLQQHQQQIKESIMHGRVDGRAVLGIKENFNGLLASGHGNTAKAALAHGENEVLVGLGKLNQKSSKQFNSNQQKSKASLATTQVNKRTQAISTANELAKLQKINNPTTTIAQELNNSNMMMSSPQKKSGPQSANRRNFISSSVPRDDACIANDEHVDDDGNLSQQRQKKTGQKQLKASMLV